MPIQPILQGDIPELRQISQPVTQFDNQLAELVADLMDTLEAHRGLGLSAPKSAVCKTSLSRIQAMACRYLSIPRCTSRVDPQKRTNHASVSPITPCASNAPHA
nr:peptide deformylase [Alicyclobacillus sacchari]